VLECTETDLDPHQRRCFELPGVRNAHGLLPTAMRDDNRFGGGAELAFRRAKTDVHLRSQEWHDWIDRTRADLSAIGLPAEVYSDEARWLDFLQNGHLHWHESTGFEFGHLPPAQLAALHRLLEREYGAAERCPPLLGWVRVRCGAV
jgi:hypothetical protein